MLGRSLGEGAPEQTGGEGTSSNKADYGDKGAWTLDAVVCSSLLVVDLGEAPVDPNLEGVTGRNNERWKYIVGEVVLGLSAGDKYWLWMPMFSDHDRDAVFGNTPVGFGRRPWLLGSIDNIGSLVLG